MELRMRLLDGRLCPGQAVRPDSIGEELGVSSVPVREALRILEGERQVVSRPHRGYIVTELNMEELAEIYKIREILETEAARLATPHIQTRDIEEMNEAIEEMENIVSDVFRLRAANRRFHFALFEAARMPYLIQMISGLWDISEPIHYRSQGFMHPENLAQVNEEHRRIVKAIVAGEINFVLDELSKHRQHAADIIEHGLLESPSAASS